MRGGPGWPPLERRGRRPRWPRAGLLSARLRREDAELERQRDNMFRTLLRTARFRLDHLASAGVANWNRLGFEVGVMPVGPRERGARVLLDVTTRSTTDA